MSEGNKLSYKIEFESDEESLIESISEAISNTRPEIDNMLRDVVADSFRESVRDGIRSAGKDRIDVSLSRENAAAVLRAKEDSTPVPIHSNRTVVEMLEDAMSTLENPSFEIDSVVKSAMTVMISQITEYMSNNSSGHTRMLLKSAVSDVAIQGARFEGMSEYFNLGTVVSMLDSLTEGIGRRGGMERMPDSLKDGIMGIMGRELGIKAVSEQLEPEEGSVDIMSIKELMEKVGVSTDDAGDIKWERVAVALRESGVEVGMYEPVVRQQEAERFDRIVKYLEENLGEVLKGVISAEREALGFSKWNVFGDKPELDIRKFGTIIDEARDDIERLDADVTPPSEFDGIEDMAKPQTHVSFDSLVGALNRLIGVLDGIGQPEAAKEAMAALDGLLGQAERHARSGDGD